MTFDALGFVGWLTLCVGVWMLSPAWALIVGGGMMMALAIKVSMAPIEKSDSDEAQS